MFFSAARALRETLVLQVTGLLATRCDEQGNRVIRNSIGCIGELDDELVLRGIAVAALEGKALEDLVDKAVDFDEFVAEGFSVSSTLPDSFTKARGPGGAGKRARQDHT